MARNIKGKRISLLSNVKNTYQHCYPSDVCGNEIDENLSFCQILARMQEGVDFYDMIKVEDSIVRERIFTLIATLANIDVSEIYTLWYNADVLAANSFLVSR